MNITVQGVDLHRSFLVGIEQRRIFEKTVLHSLISIFYLDLNLVTPNVEFAVCLGTSPDLSLAHSGTAPKMLGCMNASRKILEIYSSV